MLIRLLFLFISFYGIFCDDSSFFGPAHATIEDIEECENPALYQHPMNFTLKKMNRTHAGLNGCYTLPVDLDESSKFQFLGAIWGDGGWKPNAWEFHGDDICNTLRKDANSQWLDILKSMDIDAPDCPVPKGTYCFENFMIYLENVFPGMIYGRFRMDCKLSLKDIDQFSCMRVYTTILPRKGKHKK